jgi:hypothetical protein
MPLFVTSARLEAHHNQYILFRLTHFADFQRFSTTCKVAKLKIIVVVVITCREVRNLQKTHDPGFTKNMTLLLGNHTATEIFDFGVKK